MATASLDELPNEVLQQILFYIPPSSIFALLQVSRRFKTLAHPLLWQYHCRSQFKYWEPERHIEDKFRDNVHRVDWKNILMERQLIDRSTNLAIDSILSSQNGRTEKFEHILKYGYDAKDTLLRNINVGDEVEDVLARRYHSNELLDYVHREKAIKEWVKMASRQEVSLEKALAAFDMFVLHGREGDFDEISAQLDTLARDITEQYVGIGLESPRRKAITIARYLRAHNFVGLKEGGHYHDLQNSFMGIALLDEDHPSMPPISVAIYCCVAKRLDLNAQPCGYPYHVIAVIKSVPGHDLNGNSLTDSTEIESMYMDPHRSDLETPVDNLQGQLRVLGAPQSKYQLFLNAASSAEIIIRTSRNIMNSVQIAHQGATQHQLQQRPGHSNPLSTFPDVEGAFYGALWASLLLGMRINGDEPLAITVSTQQFLPYLIQHLETHFPTDISFIEEYIIPLVGNSGESEQLRETLRVMRAADSTPKQVKRRTNQASQAVRYKIGQIFIHKRYGYQAVIIGWDVECDQSEQWMEQMRVHELSRGKNQSFYHALVEDKSVRYVAEENIAIVKPDMPCSLLNLAGRHFKRWDEESHTFISNIKDEYPDD